ncbi:DSBA-like thioredoxin domain-containing protein [Lipomyces japonicus]|uniref:DSBA-like thioredoxin domain-containing protein n=1 Tax=Lipomyces japonicus TaxID=56871 RepID=UPI0034CFBB5D
MSVISISIVSDVVCPWCYVGITQLQKAIQAFHNNHPDTTFNIKWHAFELNPTLEPIDPSKKVLVSPKVEHLERKFGSLDRIKQMSEFLKERANSLGIKIDTLGGNIGSTRLAHESIAYAGQKNKQTELSIALFEAYFSRNEDIFSKDDILRVAKSVDGINVTELDDYISTGKGRNLVDDEIRKYRAVGGVPDFTIQGQVKIHGGQDAAVFEQIFERLV